MNITLTDHGVRKYDYNLGQFTSIDPLWEKYYGWTPYHYCGNNPVMAVDPSGFDWLEYSGQTVTWYGGDMGNTNEIKGVYNATSGYADEEGNYQSSEFQCEEGLGPIPEGDWEIDFSPNIKEAKTSRGYLVPSTTGGIETVPVDEDGYTKNPEWGYYRIKILPSEGTNTCGRNNLYFHDSQKGSTHGCIEISPNFFIDLLNYKAAGNNQLDVRVNYTEPTTNGGTYNQQYIEENFEEE